MSRFLEYMRYARGQVSRDRDMLYLPYGDTRMEGPIRIPQGVRKVWSRGTRLRYRTGPTDWAPINVVGIDGLYFDGVELIDEGKVISHDERPGFYAQDCVGLTVDHLVVEGFAPCAVFRRCHGLTINLPRLARSGSWNILLDDCHDFAINGGSSNMAWLDGIKLKNSSRGTVNDMTWNGNGLSAKTNPRSNGNGVDTYTGSHDITFNRCGGNGNRGAVINLKTGPKDAIRDAEGRVTGYAPTHNIRINDAWGEDNQGPIIDLNSMSSMLNVPAGDPPLSPIPGVTINGVTGRRNGGGKTVRIGHGVDVLTDGVWDIDGELFIAPGGSEVTKRHILRNQP